MEPKREVFLSRNGECFRTGKLAVELNAPIAGQFNAVLGLPGEIGDCQRNAEFSVHQVSPTSHIIDSRVS